MRRILLHITAAISILFFIGLGYEMLAMAHHRIPGTHLWIDAHFDFIYLCIPNGSGLRTICALPTGILVAISLAAPFWWGYRQTDEGRVPDRT